MDEIKVDSNKLSWEEAPGYPAGTQWKVLRLKGANDARSFLLRLPSHFEIETHSHIHREHHYVLEGEYESGNERFAAGSYRMIPRKMEHGPFHSEGGAVILVIWEE